MIDFFVPGIPAPGGSKRAFVIDGKARIMDDCRRNKPWRAVVALAARTAYQGPLIDEAIAISVVFVMQRPKRHVNKHSQLRASAPTWHTTTPDATKLLRALEDACTGVLWTDDSRIVRQSVEKRYGDPPGAHVTVTRIDPT